MRSVLERASRPLPLSACEVVLRLRTFDDRAVLINGLENLPLHHVLLAGTTPRILPAEWLLLDFLPYERRRLVRTRFRLLRVDYGALNLLPM